MNTQTLTNLLADYQLMLEGVKVKDSDNGGLLMEFEECKKSEVIRQLFLDACLGHGIGILKKGGFLGRPKGIFIPLEENASHVQDRLKYILCQIKEGKPILYPILLCKDLSLQSHEEFPWKAIEQQSGTGGELCTAGNSVVYRVTQQVGPKEAFYHDMIGDLPRYSLWMARKCNDPIMVIERGKHFLFETGCLERQFRSGFIKGSFMFEYGKSLDPKIALAVFNSLKPLPRESKDDPKNYTPVGSALSVHCKHLRVKEFYQKELLGPDMKPKSEAFALTAWGANVSIETALLIEKEEHVKLSLCCGCPQKGNLGTLSGLAKIDRDKNTTDPCPYLHKAKQVMPTILRLIGEPKEVGPLTISAEWDDHRGSLAFIGRKRDEILIKVFNPVGWELKQQGEKLLLTVWRTKKMPLERVNFLIPQNWQRFSSCQLVGPKVESIREAEDWVRSHN